MGPTEDHATLQKLLLLLAAAGASFLLPWKDETALTVLGEEPWSPVPAVLAASSSPRFISGVVRDEAGAPLGGVELLLTRCGSALDGLVDPLETDLDAGVLARGRSDAAGRFELALAHAGDIDLVARRPGRVDVVRPVDAALAVDHELVLVPGLSVTGRVVDDRGHGIVDARLATLRPGARPAFGELVRWLADAGIRSQADGSFRLGGFVHGRTADLVAWAPGRIARVVAGVQPGRPLDVQLGAAQALAGRVLDGAGSGVGGARVEALGALEAGLELVAERRTTSGADGSFRLDGWPDTFGRDALSPAIELNAWTSDGAGWARAELTVTAAGAGATLRLEPTPRQRIKIRAAGGAPIVAARVLVLTNGEPGSEQPGGALLCAALTDGRGETSLVMPADLGLRLRVERVGFLPRELEATDAATLELRLVRAGGISLELVDDRGCAVPNGFVRLVSGGDPTVAALRLDVDAAGRVRSDGIAPGVYRLGYEDGLSFGPVPSSTAAKAGGAGETPRIAIRAGRTLHARWSLTGGSVLDASIEQDGAPVAHALLGAAADPSDLALQLSTGAGTRRADTAGRARLFVRPTGPRVVFARRSERRPATAVRVEAGVAAQAFALELDDGGLSGAVASGGGEPVVCALVRLAPDGVGGVRRAPVPMAIQASSAAPMDWEAAFEVALGELAVRTDERGRFAFRGLPAGAYTLAISCPGYAPCFPRPLVIVAGEDLDLGEVRLEPQCGLEGRIADATQGGGYLRLFDEHGELVGQEMLDVSGGYRFDGLAPGIYRAQAVLADGKLLERELDVRAVGRCIGDFAAGPGEGKEVLLSGLGKFEEKGEAR